MHAEVSNVLFAEIAALLVVVVFVCSNEHLKIVNFLCFLNAFHQLLDLSYFREHIDYLAEIVFRREISTCRLLLLLFLACRILGKYGHSLLLVLKWWLVLSFETLVASLDQLVQFFVDNVRF